jgi:hypothetical protein
MTDMVKADGAVLKSDELGRVRTPPERREQLLNEFERSGLTGIKFAGLVGIKYPTFATWLMKRRRQRGAGAKVPAKAVDTMHWLEAVVEQAQNCGGPNHPGLVLELPGGARAQIGDPKQALIAAALLRALEKPC